MNIQERHKAFSWLKDKLNLEEELCQYFYARFNPQNQFTVRTMFEGAQEDVDCFRMDERYYKSINTYVDPLYIISVTPNYD